jgi:putative ABC transport system permease protein
MKRDFPEIEEITRINYQGGILVKKDNRNVQDNHAAFADSTFFKVFTVPMIEGNPSTALKEPNSIVIDETTAKNISTVPMFLEKLYM